MGLRLVGRAAGVGAVVSAVVMITGSRTCPPEIVWRWLEAHCPSLVIHGGARGADRWAEEWADQKGCPTAVVRPRWNAYGKAAGPRRNRVMAFMCARFDGSCVAFWDGQSRGTRNAIHEAREAGLSVEVVRF